MRLLVAGALFLLLGLVLYGDSLGGYFLADDFAFMGFVHEGWAQQPWDFLHRFYAPDPGATGTGFHRPLTFLSLGLDYAMWGTNATGFRITNLLIHVGCALLLWRLTWSWTRSRDVSWLAALLFLVCPVQTEAVMWIVARDETLAVFFMLLVLNITLATPPKTESQRSFSVLGIVLVLCAFWSKESALMLAPTFTAYYLMVPDSAGPHRLRRALTGSLWIWIVTCCYLVSRYVVLQKFGGTYPGYDPPDYFSLDYLGTRLDYLLVCLAPLEGETFPAWLRWVTGIAALALVVSLFADRDRDRSMGMRPGTTTFVLCWLALASMPYLWTNIDPETFQDVRHLYPVAAPFCILIALGAASVADRFLPAAGAVRVLAGGTLIVLLCCATWLTKQAHLEASVISRKIVADVHRLLEKERHLEGDRVVFQNLPSNFRGAHIGIAMTGMLRPPFLDLLPFAVEALDDSQLSQFVVSYLKAAREPERRVVRYLWDPDDERFRLQQKVADAVTLRGVVSAADDQPRLRHHDIRLQSHDDRVALALRQLNGNTVELSGRVSTRDGVRTIDVASVRQVDRILEVPEVVHPGGEIAVRIHGPPGSHYLLFPPNLPGFIPLHEFGTFLVATDVDQFTKGKVPPSGVAVHRMDVPGDIPVDDTRFHYQAVMEVQDPQDPRLFVLSACPGFVVRPRQP